MEVAYIAGPYRAPDFQARCRNILNARDIAAGLWRLGYAALCPHLNTAHFDGIVPDQAFLDGALEMMRRCDRIVLAPNWQRSHGTREEIREALRLCLPIHEWPNMGNVLSESHFNLD